MPSSDHRFSTKTAVVLAVLVAVIGIGAWFWYGTKNTFPSFEFGTIKPSTLSFGGTYDGPPLLGNYKNERFHFAIDLPEGFAASELPADEGNGTAIILQNERGEGIQIYVTPATEDRKTLTAHDIQASIPDMQVSEAETIEIGNEYRGVAFLSDNEAFEGRSREVWFYFRGNLYQISTYARLDGLLKAMFATWKFF